MENPSRLRWGWKLGEVFCRIFLKLRDAGVTAEGNFLSLVVDGDRRSHLSKLLAGNGAGGDISHDGGKQGEKQGGKEGLHDSLSKPWITAKSIGNRISGFRKFLFALMSADIPSQMISLHDARRLLGCIVMSAALFLAAGGHLALLQGVAWVTMVHDFSRTGSLSQAVGKTFDGHHPCPLCKKIAMARTSQEKAPVTMKVDKKAEVFITVLGSELPLPVSRSVAYGAAPFVAMPERFFAPPVPVPIDRHS